MNWTLVALIVCSVAALGWSKVQQCCTPPQWTGAVEIHKTIDGQRQPLVGMLYFLDHSTGKCIKKKLTEDFPKDCTPKSNGTFFDQYLGVRGGYRVQEWFTSYPTFDESLFVQPVDEFYQGAECYPVLRLNEGRGDKNGSVSTAIYKYFETGIRARDQSKFDIPKECLDAQTVSKVPYDYAEHMTTLGV